MAIFVPLVMALAQLGVAKVLLAEHGVKRKVGYIVRAIALLIIGSVLLGLMGAFLLLALFFQLADLTDFVWPALVTSGIGLLLGMALALEGWRSLRRK